MGFRVVSYGFHFGLICPMLVGPNQHTPVVTAAGARSREPAQLVPVRALPAVRGKPDIYRSDLPHIRTQATGRTGAGQPLMDGL